MSTQANRKQAIEKLKEIGRSSNFFFCLLDAVEFPPPPFALSVSLSLSLVAFMFLHLQLNLLFQPLEYFIFFSRPCSQLC